jgi:hypothetical protein
MKSAPRRLESAQHTIDALTDVVVSVRRLLMALAGVGGAASVVCMTWHPLLTHL